MGIGRKAKPKFRERNRKRKDVVRNNDSRKFYFYRDTLFASMLEVSWAAFFDAMSIEWEYEPTRIPLLSGKTYPPDFYLPNYGVYVECKGNYGGEWDNSTLGSKLEEAVEVTGKPFLLVRGSPRRSILNLGDNVGLTFFVPSPIGVLVAPNINLGECQTCGKVVFFRTSPSRFTAAPCKCGDWPNYLSPLVTERIRQAIEINVDNSQVSVLSDH